MLDGSRRPKEATAVHITRDHLAWCLHTRGRTRCSHSRRCSAARRWSSRGPVGVCGGVRREREHGRQAAVRSGDGRGSEALADPGDAPGDRGRASVGRVGAVSAERAYGRAHDTAAKKRRTRQEVRARGGERSGTGGGARADSPRSRRGRSWQGLCEAGSDTVRGRESAMDRTSRTTRRKRRRSRSSGARGVAERSKIGPGAID